MKKFVNWFRRWFIRIYLWLAGLLYHQFAWAYDAVAWLVSWGHWSTWRLDALGYLPDGEILEVGFGTGALLIELAKNGRHVVGLEASPQMHQVTVRKIHRENLSVKRVQGCTQSLPFPEGSFDAIVATFPAEYIAEKVSLAEFYRVLKPDGRVVIVGINIQFTSSFKSWVSNWILGSKDQSLIQYLAQKAARVGFNVQIAEHQHKGSQQTVMILRHKNG